MRPPVFVFAVFLAGFPPLATIHDPAGPLLVQWHSPEARRTSPATNSSPAPPRPNSTVDEPLLSPWGVGITFAVAVISGAVALFLLRLISLRAMGVVADAKLALAEKRTQLAAVRSFPADGSVTLSPTEIENLIASGFPEIEPELRAPLAHTIAAAIKEKAVP